MLLCSINEPQSIKGKGFTGYIFPVEHPVYLTNEPLENRFTPVAADVVFAEKAISANIKSMSSAYHKRKLVIHKNLRKYIRQYVGFKNEKGQRILWVNCIWKESSFCEGAQKDIISVSDGGTSYWNIKVNLDSGEVHELRVNTSG